MYQSSGTEFDILFKSSLATLKCAISGASPLQDQPIKRGPATSGGGDKRFGVVHGHTRANEFDPSRPITLADL